MRCTASSDALGADPRHQEEHGAFGNAVRELVGHRDDAADGLRIRPGVGAPRARARRCRQLDRARPAPLLLGAGREDLGEIGLARLLPGHEGLHVAVAAEQRHEGEDGGDAPEHGREP